ncbi:unnamed protein product [Notodromas monacha]|uniref:Oxaloacetate tautomerase FAHD1, mitochondrial n=1 Tax=Notodromas monacha TaxID=399045 RepID=A0A7R9GFV2_9CRUS|nr:unnamed protein product [Notodromas monacha]CAG0921062.1 unnamed protein product [Notodromas monacha]
MDVVTRFPEFGKKILCVGYNYRDRVEEMGKRPTERPLVFLKPSTSYVQCGQDLLIPPRTRQLEHEIELGAVISKKGKSISEDDAMDFVGGYCAALDMTARDLLHEAKARGQPWTIAKGFDTSCAVGEFIPKSRVPNPHVLELWCKVNGTMRQKANTSQMIYKIPELISYLSEIFTLEPGDFVLTGTPEGVSKVVPGDVIEGGITDLTTFTFTCSAAMDVLRDNVGEVMPLFTKMLEICDFVAIDTEITGICLRKNPFDTLDERYSSSHRDQAQFLVIQYGVCGFLFDNATRKYVYHPFNFYVFPAEREGLQNVFACLPSSLEFLVSHGFDFNKLIKDGVRFIRLDRAKVLTEKLVKNHEEALDSLARNAKPSQSNTTERIPIPKHLAVRMKDVVDRVDKMMGDPANTSVTIEDCQNPFLRKLIYSEVEHKYNNLHLSTDRHWQNGTNKTRMVISKGSADEQLKLNYEKKREELQAEIGFSSFIARLSESKKLVVGHNAFADLLHTIDQFVEEAPPDLASFKKLMLKYFPRSMDTKVLCRSKQLVDRITSSVLEDLVGVLSSEDFSLPEFVAAEGFPSYSLNCEKVHKASYDAFLTGVCFVGLATALGASSHELGGSPPKVDVNSSNLAPYVNKINSMIADMPFYDLENEQGRCFVYWISDTSAYVGINDKSKIDNVRALEKSPTVQMSNSETDPGAKFININQLSLPQLNQLKQQLDQEIELFTGSLQQLKMAESKFQESANNLAELKADGGNAISKDLLVPLSSSMYVQGQITDRERVMIEIGTGYYVTMDFNRASDYFKRKVAFVNTQMNKVQEAGQEKFKIRSAVEELLRQKIQSQMQAQGKPVTGVA